MGEERYAELHAHSAFTFLEATDTPQSLVDQAQKLGLSALAVLDVDGMYSAVQTARATRSAQLPAVYGAELTLGSTPGGSLPGESMPDASPLPGTRLPVLVSCEQGYRDLCELLSNHFLAVEGRREASLTIEEIADYRANIFVLTGTGRGPVRQTLKTQGFRAALKVIDALLEGVGQQRLGIESNLQPHDPPELADYLADLARERDLPLVATGAVRCATPEKQPLADVLSATRLNRSLDQAEANLPAWRSFLRTPQEMLRLHRRHPEAVRNAAELGDRFAFDFRILNPGLPHFPVPRGWTEVNWLRSLTYEGAAHYYGSRTENAAAWEQIDHELQIIESLGFPGYFLIVKDIVDFCRRSGILYQGRGSAANSAVCYALSITAVDAVKHKMLFERFLSPQRREAPDIDLDIEAKERERVLQYVYERYGRRNAAMVANVITYRPKSALRDSGRALGFSEGQVHRWTKQTSRSFTRESKLDRKKQTENNPGFSEPTETAKSHHVPHASPRDVPRQVMEMAGELQRLPRHMGIHPGGMVLTRTPVSQICPVRWGAMPGRTVLQWDKEDCADAGLVKFDLLGLGMLTALRRSFDWLEKDGVSYRGRPLSLHNLPEEDPRVYDLLCAADTVGVFQVESRAQMNTLPRLKPRCFYDLVVEVALIRPGPIQGRAVNPYLRRKNGREEVKYLHPLMKPSLEKTLGVPLFQEQLMQIAVDVADFTPGQADELRRAIGAKRVHERMATLKPALFAGMAKNGVQPQVQEQIFEQLQGFAEFGFPESHAFSFAFLVYASAWLKVFHPEHFYASILSSQPMGFYSRATLVADARRHGVIVTPPSVVFSEVLSVPQPRSLQEKPRLDPSSAWWDSNPQQPSGNGSQQPGQPSSRMDTHPDLEVRLGLENIKGLGEAAQSIVQARQEAPFVGIADLAVRAGLTRPQMEKLAAAGALFDLGVSRREGLWAAGAVASTDYHQPFLPGTQVGARAPDLPPMSAVEEVIADFAGTKMSTRAHPLEFVRSTLSEKGALPLDQLSQAPLDRQIWIAGLVTHRQRPGTARGTTFLSLEDETGLANVICSPGLWRRYRNVALEADALLVRGTVERDDGAIAVVANKLEPLRVPARVKSRDFR